MTTRAQTEPDSESHTTIHSDPLLVCLALVTQLLDHPIPMSTLRSGFALDRHGHIPPAAVPGAAARYGFQAVWVKRRVTEFPNYSMPLIAPLIDGRVAIVREINNGVASVLFAETGMRAHEVELAELERLALGETLVVKLTPKTSKQSLLPLKNEAFSWFWGTMWRFRRFYYEAMVATLVANVLTLATAFFSMTVFNRVIPAQALTSLWTLTIGVVIAMLIEFGMRWLKARLVDEGGKRADLAVNATLLREIMSVRLDQRPQSVGVFASSMRDFDSLRGFMSSALFVTVADLPFVILFLAVIWLIAGPLVWIPLAVITLLVAMAFAVQPVLMRAMRQNMQQAGEKQSVLVESLLNLESLKAHNAENYLQRRWEKSNAAFVQSFMTIRKINALVSGLTSTLSQVTTVGMIVVGVFMIVDNTLTIGALIAANILVGRSLGPISQAVQLATSYHQAKNALEMLDGLVRRPRDREHDQRYITPQGFEGHLSGENLEFKYPGTESALTIDKVSLAIAPGEHVALLGQVGSGKSTLLRLMSGLYKPSSGSVRVDNLDMLQVEPSELRGRIGYIGQDAQFFMGSLRDNLVLSDSWITDEQIMQVLKELGLYQMVAAHPRGLDMSLTEAGGGLSGGQRQLLSVARMMLRDPVYVYMDEPTANMDQNTEARVIQVLGPWLKGRTLLISTHRLQLLAWVDRIAVMQRGRIVSQGPRDELLQKLTRTAAQSKRQASLQPNNQPDEASAA